MTFNLRNSVIFLSLAIIILMGSLTIFSVTSIDVNSFLRFLLINIFVILLVLLLFNQINLNRIFSFGLILFLFNILLVLSVEIFGKEINGSKRWLDFGFLSLQPSEFMKITYALFVIYLSSSHNLPTRFRYRTCLYNSWVNVSFYMWHA